MFNRDYIEGQRNRRDTKFTTTDKGYSFTNRSSLRKRIQLKSIDTASSIEKDIVLRLEKVFNATEETIENFEISIKNIDNIC